MFFDFQLSSFFIMTWISFYITSLWNPVTSNFPPFWVYDLLMINRRQGLEENFFFFFCSFIPYLTIFCSFKTFSLTIFFRQKLWITHSGPLIYRNENQPREITKFAPGNRAGSQEPCCSPHGAASHLCERIYRVFLPRWLKII